MTARRKRFPWATFWLCALSALLATYLHGRLETYRTPCRLLDGGDAFEMSAGDLPELRGRTFCAYACGASRLERLELTPRGPATECPEQP